MTRRERRGAPPLAGAGQTGAALLFFLFVAGGCAYIVAAKLYALDPFAVTFVPVAVMVGYALVQALLRSMRVRDDQAGDNLYYMGFLFTLTSLGVSLYQFSAEGAAEEIVRNFGIAIASTIAGVALRVIFNQMRRDPLQVEQAARLELAEAARRVRRELDDAVVEITHFRRAVRQAIREGFDEASEDLERSRESRPAEALPASDPIVRALVAINERLAAMEARSRHAAQGGPWPARAPAERAEAPGRSAAGATADAAPVRMPDGTPEATPGAVGAEEVRS